MRTARPPRAPLPVFIVLIVLAAAIMAGCTDILPWNSATALHPGTTGDLQVWVLDVGQGDSSVILCNDTVILIDAGETDAGERVVSDLEKLGVTEIDLLVATHPHSDHIGGMQKVLARFPVRKVLDAGIPSTSSLYERFLATVEEKDIPYVIARRGQSVDVGRDLRILVLSPPEGLSGDDINANSIVLRVSYGTVNLLFAGDTSSRTEEAMIQAGVPLDADVLKVSHHGSSDASSSAFLSRVDPEVAVISLGKDNEYGHPHRETLAGLDAIGAFVLRTDRDGTIRIVSNGSAYAVATEENTVNIWLRPTATQATPVPSTPSGIPGTPGTAAIPVPFTLPVTIPAIPSDVTIPPVPSLTIPPLQVGNASDVSISAVQFDAPGDDTKNLNGEWVRLTNNGDEAVLLTSWTLSDRGGTESYSFPAFLIMPGNSVTVYTGDGVLNDTALFMGLKKPLWGNSGDHVTLRDGRGNIIDQWPEAGTS